MSNAEMMSDRFSEAGSGGVLPGVGGREEMDSSSNPGADSTSQSQSQSQSESGLQSIHDELVQLDRELQGKLEELANARSDLLNLASATEVAGIYLDAGLCVRRYTPSAAAIFNLTPADVGQPLAGLGWRVDMDYPELELDAQRVMGQLGPIEREVRDEGRWLQVRLLPYRTVEDHVAGVVLTLADVTARKEAELGLAADLQHTERLRRAGEHLAPGGDMQALFDGILRECIALTDAVAGTIQMLDYETDELVLLASNNFSMEMVTHFARLGAGSGSPCGRALAARQRLYTDFDAVGDEDLDGSNRLHLEAGLKSAQSTLLIARDGRLIGMMSTHWPERHRLEERELRYLDLLARQAADAIERKLHDDALREQMEELARFNALAVGREVRMIELKKEVNALRVRLGEPETYPLEFEKNG